MNLLLTIFFIHTLGWEIDNYGVMYEDSDYSVLIRATRENIESYTIPASTIRIADSDKASEGPFYLTRSTLINISFEANSKLTQLGVYCFSELLIERIDLSPCVDLKTIPNACFKLCSALKEIIFPPNLILIRSGALSNMKEITRFDFPSSLETIEGYSEKYGHTTASNAKLTTVTWSDDPHIQNFGPTMFGYCKLTEIFIPKSLKSIGMHCYCKCPIEKITVETGNNYFSTDGSILYDHVGTTVVIVPYSAKEGLVIREGVTKLADGSFSYSLLSTVGLPSTLESIGSQCFYEAEIRTISVPANVEQIGSSAFIYCQSLQSIDFNNCSIGRIRGSTFYMCTSLERVIVPPNVTVIESNAFSQCTSLDYIFIPKSVENILAGAFGGVKGSVEIEFEVGSPLQYEEGVLYNSDYSRLISYIGSESNFEVKIRRSVKVIGGSAYLGKSITGLSFEEGSEVTKIEDSAFDGSLFVHTDLPPSLIEIGKGSFKGCSKLQTINFGQSIMIIGESAFSECSSLTAIVLPPTISVIHKSAFYNCKALKLVELDEDSSLYTIGSMAFSYTGVEEIRLPKNVSSVEADAFKGSDLLLIDIPLKTMMKTIGKQAFRGCSKLHQISFGGVEEIGESSFEGCTELSDILLGRMVVSIRTTAFRGCTQLSSIRLSGSSALSTIEQFAFLDCPNLVRFILSDNTNFATDPNAEDAILYDEAISKIIVFLPAAPIRKVVVPSSVEEISAYSFSSASFLEEVLIGAGKLQSIGFAAFSGCKSLSRIQIPPSVAEIQNFAFEDCNSLKCGSVEYAGEDCDYGIRAKLVAAGVPLVALSPCPTDLFTIAAESESFLAFLAPLIGDLESV